MMLSMPFLIALIPGIVIILVTWWFKRMNFSLIVRIIPGTLLVIVGIILFYIGFVKIRGFEGAAYGILGIYLVFFAIISFIIAKKDTKVN